MRSCIRRCLASLAAALLVLTAMPAISIAGQTSAEVTKPDRPVRRQALPAAPESVRKAAAPAPSGLLVVLKSPADDAAEKAAFAAAASARGAKVAKWGLGGKAVSVETAAGYSASATKAFSADPAVAWVQPNYGYTASEWRPTDPEYGREWHMEEVGAPVAWEKTRGDKSVVVAVVDTGVDMDHPDLIDRIDAANGHDFVNDDGYPDDDDGHGTHVSGIVAATANNGKYVAGIASGCTILPVKVLNGMGFGTSQNVGDGIKWAADKGAEVINLSLGSSVEDLYVKDAVNYALDKGVVVVAAAGNSASDGASYPARYPDVIGVSALDTDLQPASFTNYGEGVDVAAPGVHILSTTWPGAIDSNGAYTGYMSGTSMASPLVAGLAALVRSQNPGWSMQQVQRQVQDTAQDLGDPGKDDYYGLGLVRADAAVTGLPAPPNDDDITGIALNRDSVTQVLDDEVDTDDVYRVQLKAGDTIDVYLRGDPAADFDLFLYGPSARSIYGDAPLDTSTNESYPERLRYRAAVAGDYYIAVHAFSGAGQYYLNYHATPALQVQSAKFSNPIAYKIKSLAQTRMTARVNASNVHAKITVEMPDHTSWTIFDQDIPNVAGQDYVFPAWNGRNPVTGKQAAFAAYYKWTLTVSKKDYGTTAVSGGMLLSNVCFTRSGHAVAGKPVVQTAYLYGSATSPQSVNVYVTGSSAVQDQLSVWVTGPAGVKYGAFPTNSPWRVGPGTPYPPVGRLLNMTGIRNTGVYSLTFNALHDVNYSVTFIE